jgi:hypothetical protein
LITLIQKLLLAVKFKTNNMLKIHLTASSGDLELVLTDEIDCDGIGLTRSTGGCFNLETTKHLMSI